MSLFQLLRFFADAESYASPDEADLLAAGSEGPKHASFHRRIVTVAIALGCLGALSGILLIVGDAAPHKSTVSVPQHQTHRGGTSVLLAPLLFAAVGVVFGTAVGCLFVPRAFLTSPAGQKWMSLIGTKTVRGARVVCLMFTLILLAFLSMLAWGVWMDMTGR